MTYLREFVTQPTPQTEPLPGRESDMVENSAGGYTFALDTFAQLDRFLILGSEGGTYYASQRDLTKENTSNLRRCIEEDGVRTVERIVELSRDGRIPKNSVALYAMAQAITHGDTAAKNAVQFHLPAVARTGSHLLEFVAFADALRGWGRALKRVVSHWYTTQPIEQLVYQTVKYRNRNEWTHRDVLRSAHPRASNLGETEGETYNELFRYITTGEYRTHWHKAWALISAFEKAKTADVEGLIGLIREHGLTREMIPSKMLSNPDVLEVLLEKMPMTALIRNLANLTRHGVLAPMGDHVAEVCQRITDPSGAVRRSNTPYPGTVRVGGLSGRKRGSERQHVYAGSAYRRCAGQGGRTRLRQRGTDRTPLLHRRRCVRFYVSGHSWGSGVVCGGRRGGHGAGDSQARDHVPHRGVCLEGWCRLLQTSRRYGNATAGHHGGGQYHARA